MFTKRILILLAVASALGPIGMQILLPAIPIIKQHFLVSTEVAQLTLSLSMLSIAFGTLFYGPLADQFGRKPVLLLSLMITVLGSVLCYFALTIELLILSRVIQSFGGAGGLVLARAIIRDVYGADDAARVIATLVMVMVVLPMLSPALGGELSARFGWRSVFIVVACLSSVVLLLSQSLLSETLRERQQFSGIRPFLRSFSSLMHSPAFRGYSLCVAFVSVVFFSFIAGAPEIMISTFERPPTEYGYYFIIVTTGFILGNEVARRFGKKFGVERMIRFGVSVSIFGILIAIGSQLTGIKHPLILFAPVALTIFGNGVTLPNAQASAINEFPQLAGTASGLTGFLQMAFSALFAQLVSIVFNGTAYPLLLIMLFASIASLYFFTTSMKQAVATKPKAAA